ncbi:Methyltransferase domain-containing protein [Paenibacillus aquistagni]|uniref:Methyltransferase domain-containing protein n=1 Tax=Paenibacillus aquistagni TaxID=1852522 RepID=A0A1X7IUP3_9BACL|nr:Methyltransferase domain-containing protein [Paenibacillus aquistagni]
MVIIREGGQLLNNHYMDKLTFEQYMELAKESFSGWDFGWLERTGRMAVGNLSWNYYNEVLPYVRASKSMLDMGTGGGEFLRLLQPLPRITYATEGYLPNIEVAKAALSPYGVEVIPVDEDEHLPLASEQFDLIINRHESYAASEVWRLLRPGGIFITQQCGGQNDIELNGWLGAPPPEHFQWSLSTAEDQLAKQSFEILRTKAEATHTRFFDIGALVYYLNIIQWQIEDFSEARYQKPLEALHERLGKDGYLDTTCDRFLIAARKPMG